MQTVKRQETHFTKRELIDALLVIQESRDNEIIIERKDDTIIYRGDGALSPGLSQRIKNSKPILISLLGNTTLALEQASLYAMLADEDLNVSEAFGLVATETGIAGGSEYGLAVCGRTKPH